MKQIKDRLMKLEYLNEVCIHSPALTIDTQCGIGRYKFSKLGFFKFTSVYNCRNF